MTNDEIKAFFIAAIDSARGAGADIIFRAFGRVWVDTDSGVFRFYEDGEGKKKCCALTAAVVGHKPITRSEQPLDVVEAITGRSRDWMWNFIFGFDGRQPKDIKFYEGTPFIEDAWQMGHEIRVYVNGGAQ
jgi:hypothetical protein